MTSGISPGVALESSLATLPIGKAEVRARGTRVALLAFGATVPAAEQVGKELGLTVVDEPLLMAPFALCHHPDARPGHYVLAGHIHPALRVEAGGDRLRLPCFAFGTDVGLLPAFGSFTGHMTLEPDAGMRCFVAAADRVLEVPHASARRRGKA